MKTIALRFSDGFATSDGTIIEHQKQIELNGYVWYVKLGSRVSDKVCKQILENKKPRVLLIHSGKMARYWAYIDKIIKETPPLCDIPEYYRNQNEKFNTWFRVYDIKEADRNIMSSCRVVSSGTPLSVASKSSMSPYFIIEYDEGGSNDD